VLPVLVAGILAWQNQTWRVLGLIVLSVVAAAAFWTSVGLALSTWVPRLGRSVSTAVALYALVGLGWPVLVRTLLWGPTGVGLAAISSFYCVFDLTYSLEYPAWVDPIVWPSAWIAAQLLVAAALLIATLVTFDRCLGRVRG
jgi:hypothetical protein